MPRRLTECVFCKTIVGHECPAPLDVDPKAEPVTTEDLYFARKQRDNALARAKGLAAQNKQLKRANHELHVAWQKEIDQRIKGEGLRARIRELETAIANPCHPGCENCREIWDSVAKADSALRARIAKAQELR